MRSARPSSRPLYGLLPRPPVDLLLDGAACDPPLFAPRVTRLFAVGGRVVVHALPFSASVFCFYYHFPAMDPRYAKANIQATEVKMM